MTNAEFQRLLDDFGDHLPAVIEHDETGYYHEILVDTQEWDGETYVVLRLGDKCPGQ